MVDPTGNFSIGSSLSALNVLGNLVGTAQVGLDLFNSVSNGESITSAQAGMFAIASLGGLKLFKAVGKKFLKRFRCGKPNEHKICKIFKSDEERIQTYRSTLRISRTKNIAFADYITSSGIGSMVAASGGFSHPGTVGLPSTTRFIAFPTGRNNRETDSERKLYENMAIRFTSTTVGLARVVSELPICVSCAGIGRQFKNDFPGVILLTKGGVTSRRSRR